MTAGKTLFAFDSQSRIAIAVNLSSQCLLVSVWELVAKPHAMVDQLLPLAKAACGAMMFYQG